MKLCLQVFGREIFSVELVRQDPAELLADVIAEISESKDQPEEVRQFGWGHAAHIERAVEVGYWPEEEDKGGFGFGPKP